MKYLSTRGSAPALDFEQVTLAGLASDGGLYVPESWPQFSADDIRGLAGLSYVETAVRVMLPFVSGSLSEEELRELCTAAYGRFSHDAVTPLVQLNDQHWLLELFHGPTLAFKDVALQLLGPAVRGSSSPGAMTRSPLSARPRATPDLRRSMPWPGARRSISSCCTRMAACRTCSAAR
jgi:threonine synthase